MANLIQEQSIPSAASEVYILSICYGKRHWWGHAFGFGSAYSTRIVAPLHQIGVGKATKARISPLNT